MPERGEPNWIDLVIVGAGPAGLAAGIQAAARGVPHVVLERGRLAETISRYQKGKHVMDEPATLDVRADLRVGFRAGRREEVLEQWQRDCETAGVNLRLGPGCEVVGLDGGKGAFVVKLRDGGTISCANVVLAIGLQGNVRTFGVPGEHLPHVGYQLDDPGDHSDKRILVVGAGDSAIENALALAERNDVGLVNRTAEFPKAKPRNRALIEAAIKAGTIVHHANARMKEITPSHVVLLASSGELRIECDLLIGRLGALPPRSFLESLCVEFVSADEGSPPKVSETYETNVPGLYIAGELAGAPLIKRCLNEGYEVVEHILGHHVEPADTALLAQMFDDAGLPGAVDEVLERIRTALPLFREIPKIRFRELLTASNQSLGTSPFRRVAAGTPIYERNDFSEGLYSILSGAVDAVLPADDALRSQENRFRISEGDFFGEMSLLSGRRRSATLVAAESSLLIETPRLLMLALMSSEPSVRRVIDKTFIRRKLQSDLAPGLAPSEFETLSQSASIRVYEQDDALFEEGQAADGLHFIRRGSVAVSHNRADGEQILAYLPAGNLVGEMAFFAPDGLRQATVRAAIFTETIHVPSVEIAAFISRHPECKSRLQALESVRLVENAMSRASRRTSSLVDFLMDAGLGEATDVLLIDEALCIRCDNCETACAATHGGVSRLDREAGPTYATVHVPTSCRHCENPKCMTDCPPDALRRHADGEVYILDDICIGCGNCATNCPYGVIQMAKVGKDSRSSGLFGFLFGHKPPRATDNAKTLAVKCDLCQQLKPSGDRPAAACVSACPTGAILRVNPKSYVDRLVSRSEA